MTISTKTYSNGEVLTADDLNAHLTTLVNEINRLSGLHIANQKPRNLIINGNFSVWQRGVSQTSSGLGSDDRWQNSNLGSTKVHTQQTFTVGQTDVPDNPEFYSRTVVTSVANAANFALKEQRIEGVQKTSGETITLTFWAKADAAKNIAVEFGQRFGSGGSPSSSIDSIGVTTVALTTGWVKQTITVAIPSIAGKTLGTDGNDYLALLFWLDSGSNYAARNNTLGQQSGTFEIANVQIEIAATASDFEYVNEADQIARCQRYFERVLPNPAQALTTIASGFSPATSQARVVLDYAEKRDIPNVSFSADGDFATNSAGGDIVSVSMSSAFETKTRCRLRNSTTGHVAGEGILLTFNSTSGFIDIDAEL